MLYNIILLCLVIVVAALIVLREITFRRTIERYSAYDTALQTLVYNLVRIKKDMSKFNMGDKYDT